MNKVIKLYPLFSPRIYVWLRSLILPIAKIDLELPQKGQILDIGCGYGFTSLFFAINHGDRIIKGVEIDRSRIKIAKQISANIQNVTFEVDDLANQQSHRFDSIVAIDLLHHLNKDQKKVLLQQCYGLLRENGSLIVKDIDTKPPFKYWWNYLHDTIMTRFGQLDFYGSEKMMQTLKAGGFDVIKHYPIYSLLYPHYIYVCQKT